MCQPVTASAHFDKCNEVFIYFRLNCSVKLSIICKLVLRYPKIQHEGSDQSCENGEKSDPRTKPCGTSVVIFSLGSTYINPNELFAVN